MPGGMVAARPRVRPTSCFPDWPLWFAFPPAVDEGPGFPTSSPAFSVVGTFTAAVLTAVVSHMGYLRGPDG